MIHDRTRSVSLVLRSTSRLVVYNAWEEMFDSISDWAIETASEILPVEEQKAAKAA